MADISMPSPPYREGTKLSQTPMALVLNSGGIGDYINWVPSIKYVIDNNPHIYGYIFAPKYFAELAELWLGSYSSRFKLHVYERLEDEPLLQTVNIIAPDRKQLANACGFHLMHLGFIYYTQCSTMPKGYAVLPTITGDEVNIASFGLPKDYAVITTMATAENRKLPAESLNKIISFIQSKNITPVLLGKGHVANDHIALDPIGLDSTGCIDLREKTSLVEAACVMAKAKFVFGLDNGLLHLASCSEVPVVSIFTTVNPNLRISPRRNGARTYAIVPPEAIACRFCNTNMRYLIGHDFKDCVYKDNACVTSIDVNNVTATIGKLIEKDLV